METEQIIKLLSDTKAEQRVLLTQRKTIDNKLHKLTSIIQECEATLVLVGKYKNITSTGSDLATLIAEDNLRLMEAFETTEYAAIVQESVNEAKRQAQNVAINLLKKEEVVGVKERTINEVATVLIEHGDLLTAEKVKQTALNAKIVEKL